MKLYFAAPLFNEAERQFNTALAAQLEKAGFSVFLPQRDGVEKNQMPFKDMEPDVRRKAIFQLDEATIKESDIFLIILDGRTPDEGACVELGIAHTHRSLTGMPQHIVGLHTDLRAAFVGAKLNPMIKVPIDFITPHQEELLRYLSSLLQQSLIA